MGVSGKLCAAMSVVSKRIAYVFGQLGVAYGGGLSTYPSGWVIEGGGRLTHLKGVRADVFVHIVLSGAQVHTPRRVMSAND